MKKKLPFRILVVLSIILVLFTATFSASASVYVGKSSDMLLNVSPGDDADVLRSSTNFACDWNIRYSSDGTFFTNASLYSTHSQYLMHGFITQDSDGKPSITFDATNVSYWDFVNGQQSYGASFTSSTVGNVVPNNGFLTVPRSVTQNEGIERLAMFEFIENGYIVSQYLPNSFRLDAEDFYVHTDMFQYFPNGYSGITLRNISQAYLGGRSYVNVNYSFLCSDVDAAPTLYSGSYRVNLSGSELRIALLDSSIYSDLIVSNTQGFLKISDLELRVYITDNDSPRNYIGDGSSFPVLTHYPIVYGNGGGTNTDNPYYNYNVLSELYLNSVFDAYPEDKNAIDRAYNNGYKVGHDRGLYEGKEIGYNKGLAEAMEDLDFTSWIGVAVGGFLDMPIFFDIISLGDMLGVILALTFLILFLKFFAGG